MEMIVLGIIYYTGYTWLWLRTVNDVLYREKNIRLLPQEFNDVLE